RTPRRLPRLPEQPPARLGPDFVPLPQPRRRRGPGSGRDQRPRRGAGRSPRRPRRPRLSLRRRNRQPRLPPVPRRRGVDRWRRPLSCATMPPCANLPPDMADFYEFFAGGGMVRAGLGAGWTCRFANDFDAAKALSSRANWGTGGELFAGDVATVDAAALPGHADLMWGSFPCQDLSLAGAGKGLAGHRSGAFHAFWRVVQGLAADGRAPAMVAIENVCGALTSNGGRDFAVLMQTFAEGGYRPGALV